jgi:hypothetical protein
MEWAGVYLDLRKCPLTDFADLELSLHRRDGINYRVEMRFTQPDSDADIRLGTGEPANATFDLPGLQALIIDPAEYGKTLADGLFTDVNVSSAFAQARASAQSLQAPLRVRLLIGPSAPELNTLYWEALGDPQNKAPLFTGENILFSRYLSSSDWRPVKLRPQGDLRALTAVSNPSNLKDYKLAEVDAPGELGRAKEALGSIPITELGGGQAKCTLDNLMDALRDGVDILYLAAHGTVANGEPRIWLEDDDGKAAITSADELAARIRELQQQPRLIVLASCQSAGKGAGDALQALGPRLAQAGVPAVIAMQGNISMDSVKKFMPIFFAEIQKDGQIDRALAVARGTIRDAQDYWMPVLFMRLRSGKIWYVPGAGDAGEEFEKWNAVLTSIQSKQLTPILGAGLYEPLIGTWREWATAMADEYGFPLSSFYRESLPQVTQYLSVSQDINTMFAASFGYLRKMLQARFADDLSEDLKGEAADLQALMELCGKKLRERDANEQHKVLVRLKLPIYITTNADSLMADALKEAGADPKVEICPWSDRFYSPSVFDGTNYNPTPQQPLVYHLFGHISVPDSMVLTEDDYFEFLRGISSQKDLIPPRVRSALTNAATMFLGFQLDDWAFRVFFHAMMNPETSRMRARYSHIGVQVELDETRHISPKRARKYLEKYFGNSEITIFWGSSSDFLTELNKRLKPDA